jgi:hypothetical protein
MNNHREVSAKPGLLSELLRLVEQCRGCYGQERVYKRVVGLVLAEMMAFGRHTITQLLLVLGLGDEDWSGWYRLFSAKRFDEEQTSRVMVGEMVKEVAASEPFVVGVDGFHVARCSETMPGSGWMRGLQTAKFKPGIQRGQRFVEMSWLTPLEEGYSRAIPIRCLPAFTAKAVAAEQPPQSEVAAGLQLLHWVRGQLDEAGRQEQLLMCLEDGSYDTLEHWQKLPERTVAVVRTARNRALYELPPADAHGNRKYGAKAPTPQQWLQQRRGFQVQEVRVRGKPRRMRVRIEGPYVREGLPDVPLFLLVIGGGKRPPGSRRQRYEPCFFLVSAVWVADAWALPLPLADLLAWLWQRWELEVAHRQLKSGLGLGEKQCWNPAATVATVQWSIWLYALLLLAGYRTGSTTACPAPPGRWRAPQQRWSFNDLCRTLRCELWLHPDFRLTWAWSPDNPPANAPPWDSLANAVLAAARL